MISGTSALEEHDELGDIEEVEAAVLVVINPRILSCEGLEECRDVKEVQIAIEVEIRSTISAGLTLVRDEPKRS